MTVGPGFPATVALSGNTSVTVGDIGVGNTANGPGIGLRLVIINELMKANQGQILVVSELDKYTTFTV